MAESDRPEQIQNYLSGVTYPAGKDVLVNKARNNNAPEDVMQVLRDMPERQYGGTSEVADILRQRTGGRETGTGHARRAEGGQRPGQGRREERRD